MAKTRMTYDGPMQIGENLMAFDIDGWSPSGDSMTDIGRTHGGRRRMLCDNLSYLGTEALARLGLEFRRLSSGVAIVAV